MLELISASVASLPLDVAELLEPMDIGRFFEADIVIARGPLCCLPDEKSRCQSAGRIECIVSRKSRYEKLISRGSGNQPREIARKGIRGFEKRGETHRIGSLFAAPPALVVLQYRADHKPRPAPLDGTMGLLEGWRRVERGER
jgi:hypothetical protein